MNVISFFIADAQPTLLEEPSEDAFHNAAVSAQAAAMFGVAFGDVRFDAALSQGLADFCFGIVGSVGEGFLRSLPPSSAGTLDRGDGVDQRIACSESCTFAPVWISANGVP